MGRGRLRFCFLLSLIAVAASLPAPAEDALEEDINMADMEDLFRDLFIPSREARELSDEDGDNEVQDVASDVDEEEDSKVMEDTEAMDEAHVMEVARFNNYIDAIYRRMNAALRAKMMDPMELNLNDKKDQTKKKTSDKKSPRSKRDADEDEQEDEDEYDLSSDDDEDEEDETADVVEIEHRMGKTDNKKGKGKKISPSKKNKKNGKHNTGKKGKGKKKEEREAAKKEKQRQKAKKQEERMKKREEKKNKKSGNRESRSGDKKKKKKNQGKNKKSSKKPTHVGKSKNNKSNKNQKTKKGRKNNKKSQVSKKRSDLKPQDNKMLGSLSGIATLRRQGDVSVTDEDNHKIVMSEFQVGPLQLEVSKVYGNGKGRTVKSAKAITDVMTGVMTLKVKPDGTAHVKKVVFKPPQNVDVKGSLSEDRSRNLRYMKNSVTKMRPLAAIRILKTARYVLKSPSSSN